VPGQMLYRGAGLQGWAPVAYFKPNAPFVAGHSYEIQNISEDDGGINHPQFTAVAPIAISANDMAVSATLSAYEANGETVECEGFGNPCFGGTTVYLSSKTVAQLVLTLATTDAALVQQIVVSVKYGETLGSGTFSELAPAEPGISHTFETQSQSYCYAIKARSLIDGTEATSQVAPWRFGRAGRNTHGS
jgi:hypothetical protein